MLSIIKSGSILGIDAMPVDVEVNGLESGDPKFVMTGLATGAVRESTDRVISALRNSGFRLPMLRATINLAPGYVRKEGPLYDLPIALGLLQATHQLHTKILDEFLVAGELSLSGETRPVRGGLALALCARQLGLRGVLLPYRTACEAALVREVEVYGIESLSQAKGFVEGRLELERLPYRLPTVGADARRQGDFAEVKGQHSLRRAVEIAVAGGHNLLIVGPPGSGKSMVAKRIPTIMPELEEEEYLELLRIYSSTGQTLQEELPAVRPFRSPHHTISDVGLIGGGSIPGPGEISLAHHGVLFLDELPEFRRSALEVLRQPLEDAKVMISRSAGKITLPARFMLVAAMNPSPCGYDGPDMQASPAQMQRYRARLSGPLLDRFDLQVDAPALSFAELTAASPGEHSAAIRERVTAARQVQAKRYARHGVRINAGLMPGMIREYCAIEPALQTILQTVMDSMRMSARAYDRILKVARTIADLAGSEAIGAEHLLEAVQFRRMDQRPMF
jgi:magnesium chelatase family protein